jgi:hypothetical protein
MVTRPMMVTEQNRIEQRQRRSAISSIDAGLAKQLRWFSLRIQLAMSKILKSAIAATVLTVGVWTASVTPSYAKPEYAKTEGKACGYCHVTSGKPELNAAGDYYAAHEHSFKGYTPSN